MDPSVSTNWNVLGGLRYRYAYIIVFSSTHFPSYFRFIVSFEKEKKKKRRCLLIFHVIALFISEPIRN